MGYLLHFKLSRYRTKKIKHHITVEILDIVVANRVLVASISFTSNNPTAVGREFKK
jgi:hypothetical protein